MIVVDVSVLHDAEYVALARRLGATADRIGAPPGERAGFRLMGARNSFRSIGSAESVPLGCGDRA